MVFGLRSYHIISFRNHSMSCNVQVVDHSLSAPLSMINATSSTFDQRPHVPHTGAGLGNAVNVESLLARTNTGL